MSRAGTIARCGLRDEAEKKETGARSYFREGTFSGSNHFCGAVAATDVSGAAILVHERLADHRANRAAAGEEILARDMGAGGRVRGRDVCRFGVRAAAAKRRMGGCVGGS